MVNELNPSQQKAVDYDAGHLLIVAGPGTGKTHTLTHRIARVSQSVAAGEKILAITFTHKAADEMQERLRKFANLEDQKVFVGTFHQFCLSILREYATEADLPKDFQVASPETVELLAKELWPDMKRKERRLLLENISTRKAVQFRALPSQEENILKKMLREKALLDFDDLLLETVNLFNNHKEILKRTQETFRYLFVDEYQDINAVQHELLKIMVGPKGMLTAIGDPNQAIYGFRGSNVIFFNSFPDDFPGAGILSLAENYRSSANLLSASSQVMAKSKNIHVPELAARIYSSGRLTIYEAPTDKAEAEYVVHQIEKLVGGTSMFSQDSGRVTRQEEGQLSFGDVAVLYRLKSQSRALKEAFERSGIPFHISGEKTEGDDGEAIDDIYFNRQDEPSIISEKVSLMTLHSAKGLEFPCVFIVGCEENILPLDLEGLATDAEEERRLFYVGMTRAKERLFLLSAKRRLLYGKTRHNAPSVFLADIEEGLKEYEQGERKARRRKADDEQLKLF